MGTPTPDTGGIRCHIGNSKKMTEMIELEDQEELIKNEQDIETAAYKEAFDHFDWNHSGRIPTSELQYAMRRAGQNPTDVEVQDMVIKEKIMDMDTETHFKDTFRVFSKDEEGCIPAH